MNTYSYQALKGPATIRVLRLLPGQAPNDPLRCEIEWHSLASKTEYEALSYYWGPTDLTHALEIQGAQLPITQNLHSALHHLRLPHASRVLWADGVCIDQTNTEERNAQVRLMRNIYERAKKVLVWLGAAANGSTGAIEFLKHINNIATIDALLGVQRNLWEIDNYLRVLPLTTDQIWYDAFEIIKRPWFFRSWIIQELAVASEVTVICGDASVDWTTLIRAIEYTVAGRLGLTFAPTAVNNLMLIERSRRKFADGAEQGALQVLLRLRRSLATDPRDRVFAFSGLISERLTATDVDYGLSAKEVYKRLAVEILCKYRNLDIFSVPRVLDGSRVADLPSWVPDWSTSDLSESLLWKSIEGPEVSDNYIIPTYRVTGDTECMAVFNEDQTRLMLEGYIVDEIYMTSYVSESRVNYVSRDLDENIADMIEAQTVLRGWEYCAGIGTRWRYLNGELITDAYWQTLLGGNLWGSYNAMQSEFYKWFKAVQIFRFLQLLRLDRAWILKFTMLAVAKIAWLLNWPSLLFEPQVLFMSLAFTVSHRRMMRTEKGYIGLAPRLAEPGDFIMLCKGGKLPLVVRPKGLDWELIGDSYIHGMMGGDDFRKDQCKPMWFV